MKIHRVDKRKNIKTAQVPNIHDPFFSNDYIISAIKNSEYAYVLDEKEYKNAKNGTKIDQGFQGLFTKQVAGIGIKNPIIFYCEVYQFVKKTHDVTSLIFAWKYNEDDTIIRTIDSITPCQKTAASTIHEIEEGMQLSSGNLIIGRFSSYKDAKASAKEDVKKYKDIK